MEQSLVVTSNRGIESSSLGLAALGLILIRPIDTAMGLIPDRRPAPRSRRDLTSPSSVTGHQSGDFTLLAGGLTGFQQTLCYGRHLALRRLAPVRTITGELPGCLCRDPSSPRFSLP